MKSFNYEFELFQMNPYNGAQDTFSIFLGLLI